MLELRTTQPRLYRNTQHHHAARLLKIFLCAFSILTPMSSVMAASQLMVTPTRLVFEGNERSEQITVINTGDATGTYRIQLVNKRMTSAGKFEDVKTAESDELFADKMIRYSPRQVVLEPGKSQVVRLSLRKPKGITAGEYRSHLLFQAIPQNAGHDIKNVAENSKNISINLTAIVSISIPVIVRHGETAATVSFASATYEAAATDRTPPGLLLELERSGTQSVYGDLLAEFVQEGGASTVIGQVGGIAIYTPNKTRTFKLPLKIPPSLDVKKGVINVYYRSPADQGNKVLAQTQTRAN
jgi:P pilus assembly chaperone PapD